MKIVKAREMARIEELAYQEGASEEQFMLQAGEGIAKAIQEFIGLQHLLPRIILMCGKGNNGGDGFVAGAILLKAGFFVRAYTLDPFEKCSVLSQKMRHKFQREGGEVVHLQKGENLNLKGCTLIVDGLYGTGFHGSLAPLYKEVIEKVNQSKIPIISIDIPSGINGNNEESSDIAIIASKTIFLGLPKFGCFVGNNYNHVGRIQVVDFGLKQKFLEEAKGEFELITKESVEKMLPSLVPNRHKYQAGYVVGVGGSAGMPGAPLLASHAALKTGAGIVRLFHPESLHAELAAAPLEIIRHPFREGDYQAIISETKRAKALFVGPGMGRSSSSAQLLTFLFEKINNQWVIDADALFLIANHRLTIPKGALLTPHQGEMKHLLGIEGSVEPLRLLAQTMEFCEKHEVVILLKGAPTFILAAGHLPYVLAMGDPGMATAGSGDVLTGILAALLAQGLTPLQGALLGSYLHGRAGQIAAKQQTSFAMMASDLITYLPEAFKELIK